MSIFEGKWLAQNKQEDESSDILIEIYYMTKVIENTTYYQHVR